MIYDKKYFLIIGGLDYGFTNDSSYTPSLSTDVTVWNDWLCIENDNIVIETKIDPIDNEPTVSSIKISLLNKNISTYWNLWQEIFLKNSKFATILNDGILRSDTVSDTFTVADASKLGSNGQTVDMWIDQECIRGTLNTGTNTVTITQRSRYESILQQHDAYDEDNQIFSYVYTRCPTLIGRIVYLYECVGSTESLIYKGIIEPGVYLERGKIYLTINNFLEVLKIPFIKDNNELDLYGVSFYRDDGWTPQVTILVQDEDKGGLTSLIFDLDNGYYEDGYSVINEINEKLASDGTFNEYVQLSLVVQYDGKVKIKAIRDDTSVRYILIKMTNGLIIFLNGSVECPLNYNTDYDFYNIEIVCSSDTVLTEFYHDFTNPIANNFFLNIHNTDEIKFYSEQTLAVNDQIAISMNDGSQSCRLLITDYTSHLVTATRLSHPTDIFFNEFNCSANKTLYYIGNIVDLLDNLDSLGSGIHPELFEESDFDIDSFRALSFTTEFIGAYNFSSQDNLFEILKNFCKMCNAALYVSAAGKISAIQLIPGSKLDEATIMFGEIPVLEQIPPLTRITYNWNDNEILQVNANNKLLNVHLYPKYEDIDFPSLSFDYTIIPKLAVLALQRFNFFSKNIFMLKFTSTDNLEVGNQYEIVSDFLDDEFTRCMIISKSINMKSPYEYEAYVFLSEHNAVWSPCCYVTSLVSYVGTCKDTNLYSTTPVTDLTYLDPVYYGESTINCVVFNNSVTYDRTIIAVNEGSGTITFDSGGSPVMPSTPFCVMLADWDDTVTAAQLEWTWICDQDDRLILDDEIGSSWI